jgi:MraZ protein
LWGKVGKSGELVHSFYDSHFTVKDTDVFLGEYEHSVDAKGRIAVPARYRSRLEQGLVITRSFDQCLLVYPQEEWETLSQKLNGLSFVQDEVRKARRMLFGNAFELELDRQGRILLPGSLREYAKIDNDAIVAGMGSYIEMWSAEMWRANQDDLTSDSAEIAETLASLGL